MKEWSFATPSSFHLIRTAPFLQFLLQIRISCLPRELCVLVWEMVLSTFLILGKLTVIGLIFSFIYFLSFWMTELEHTLRLVPWCFQFTARVLLTNLVDFTSVSFFPMLKTLVLGDTTVFICCILCKKLLQFQIQPTAPPTLWLPNTRCISRVFFRSSSLLTIPRYISINTFLNYLLTLMCFCEMCLQF